MTEKRHNILVVGAGSIGERHLRCFQATGRCQLAFCEPNDKRRAEVSRRLGIKAAFSSLERARSQGEFSAAVVATPAPSHIPLALELAEGNCHVLLEKPVSLTLDRVAELAKLVKSADLVCAVGYMHRAHSGNRALKAAIESGKLGELRQIRIQQSQPLAVLRPAYHEVYFASHKQGGGALHDFMTHLYNLGEHLAGPIERVFTDAAHQGLDGVEVEDTVHSLTRQGDVMGAYTCNLTQQANEFVVTVVGDRGMGRVDYVNQRWSLLTEPLGEWQHHRVDIPDWDCVYRAQNEAFLDAIEGTGAVFCDLESGIQTLGVNLASAESWKAGEWKTTTQITKASK